MFSPLSRTNIVVDIFLAQSFLHRLLRRANGLACAIRVSDIFRIITTVVLLPLVKYNTYYTFQLSPQSHTMSQQHEQERRLYSEAREYRLRVTQRRQRVHSLEDQIQDYEIEGNTMKVNELQQLLYQTQRDMIRAMEREAVALRKECDDAMQIAIYCQQELMKAVDLGYRLQGQDVSIAVRVNS